MKYIVYVMWDLDGIVHKEYYPIMELDEAKRFADDEADDLKKRNKKGEIGGYSVLIYELTNY